MKKTIQIVERNNDLNSRQWKLYNWLVTQDRLVSLNEIYDNFEIDYPDYRKERCTWANSSARRQITDDLNAIANSKCIYRVLIRSVNGIGFLSEEETEAFMKNEHIRILKEMTTFHHQVRKMKLNNQLRLTFANEREMIESYKKVGAANG